MCARRPVPGALAAKDSFFAPSYAMQGRSCRPWRSIQQPSPGRRSFRGTPWGGHAPSGVLTSSRPARPADVAAAAESPSFWPESFARVISAAAVMKISPAPTPRSQPRKGRRSCSADLGLQDGPSMNRRRPKRSAHKAETGVAKAMNRIATHRRSRSECRGMCSVETP